MTEPTVLTVFVAAMITALATGLGAIPFFFVKHMRRWWLGIANAIASGVMLTASFNLLQEALSAPGAIQRTVLGMSLGLVLVLASHRFLADRNDGAEPLAIGALRGKDALEALLIVGVMTAHSFTEGAAVGVAYGSGETLGRLLTTTIALHNVPEGLAISLVLVPRGVSAWRAAGWSIFSSLPQPLMAVPAFIFVQLFHPMLPVGLGFAAGAMLWVVFGELVPDANAECKPHTVAFVVTASCAAMLAVQGLLR